VASQFARAVTVRVALDKEVIRPPTEMFCLEVDLRDGRVDQNRGNPGDHQLPKPVGTDVLFEHDTGAPRCLGAGYSFFWQVIAPSRLVESGAVE